MTTASSSRAELCKANVVVVKVGSRSIADHNELFDKLARDIAQNRRKKRRFVLVSSGAIALGYSALGYRRRPRDIARLQAAAATGQSTLMRHYVDAFARQDITCAQVLLTHADLADRVRLNNARQAIQALHDAGAVPIVNENDTVATDEIRLDNDLLASMVVSLIGADLLVLLTDVDGVLDRAARRISVMDDRAELGHVRATGINLGRGGITSKLDAARKAGLSGARTVVARASHPDVLGAIFGGEDIGTLFPAAATILPARKHWIAFTLRPLGAILIDDGAARAVTSEGRSLLSIGIVGVRGHFQPGDAVSLIAVDGREVARGLARLTSEEISRTAGRLTPDAANSKKANIVVHRDDLVTCDFQHFPSTPPR